MTTQTTRAPEETRRRLLQAAFQEFYRNGFQGGSLNRIVAEAGATKGALFHHFAGKNELGYAVLEEVVRPQIEARWFVPMTGGDDPIEALKQAMISFADEGSAASQMMHGCPLNNLAQEMAPLDETFRLRIEAVYADWRSCLEAAFSRGIAAGIVRPEVIPARIATFTVAALEGMLGTAKNAQSWELLRQAGEEFFEYLETLRP